MRFSSPDGVQVVSKSMTESSLRFKKGFRPLAGCKLFREAHEKDYLQLVFSSPDGGVRCFKYFPKCMIEGVLFSSPGGV